jgi:uncharacterized protein (TIGR00730 family)
MKDKVASSQIPESKTVQVNVTVFGGSKPKPGEPDYEAALQLGRLLGAAGYAVLTGGYIGTMEAVSRGAAETGGHVIGVTCDEIESWRPVKPNPWVMEERRYPALRERMYALIDNCDAALVLPGGIGTLAELAAMWSQLQTGASTPRPLILIGDGWQTTLNIFYQTLGAYIHEKDLQWLYFVPDVGGASDQLQSLLPVS